MLSHRLLDARTREACAGLYGLELQQWDVLFLRSAHDFERALGRSPSTLDEPGSAAALAASLPPELSALEAHRDQVKALIHQAHLDYEGSPAFSVETWLRRIAIVLILALTAYFYWREEQTKKPVPYAPYLTQPRPKQP
ncbi:MAG: hypothetical protein IPJ65_13170 [Archangiaceae bacterium]|nr:hypothetical protein [Archangiaceae bacterium]